jgi:hypothetical protein
MATIITVITAAAKSTETKRLRVPPPCSSVAVAIVFSCCPMVFLL